MEQRIKLIWFLSLTSILFIGAGQGYWLWNQCQYKNEELLKNVHAHILDTVALNDSIRNLQSRRIFTDSASISWSTSSTRSIEHDSLADKERKVYGYMYAVRVSQKNTDDVQCADTISTDSKKKICYSDTIFFRTNLELGWSMEQEVQKYILQVESPFTLERFDSLLAVKLSGISFSTNFCIPRDSIFVTRDTVILRGTRLCPVIEVIYPYNPLKWQQVRVVVRPQLHTLLLRMGWQLLGSLLMILLLFVCLLFQIKTILKQRRIDEIRRDFVNTMIHELKRPVQTLKICVTFLGDKQLCTDEQTVDRVIGDSIFELDNLSTYLQKLRDMNRSEDERPVLSMTSFNLRSLVEKLIRLQHAPAGKQLFFETRFTDNLQIVADEVHIASIIGNLIEKAVKYSDSTVHIRVECSLSDHRLTLTVTDDGIGIPASEQGKVFDKFYRCTNLPDCALPGIGLGLSYVKLLVKVHQGTVSLSSRLGRGTTVTVVLPQ